MWKGCPTFLAKGYAGLPQEQDSRAGECAGTKSFRHEQLGQPERSRTPPGVVTWLQVRTPTRCPIHGPPIPGQEGTLSPG